MESARRLVIPWMRNAIIFCAGLTLRKGPYADCKCKNSCPTEKDDPINCAEEDCKSEDNETCKEVLFYLAYADERLRD